MSSRDQERERDTAVPVRRPHPSLNIVTSPPADETQEGEWSR